MKSLFNLPGRWSALIAEHPGLQETLGGGPSCWPAYYRYSVKLRKNSPALRACLDDAREQPTAESERKRYLILLRTPERDDRLNAAFFQLGIDTGVVVALVSGARLGPDASGVECVDERSDEVRLLPPSRLDLPRHGKPGLGTDSGVNLEAVIAAAFASRDSGAVTPRSVRVAEPLTLFASLADVALREICWQVDRVYFQPFSLRPRFRGRSGSGANPLPAGRPAPNRSFFRQTFVGGFGGETARLH
jgi:hypothetical protein